jgi:hypothetical protein
MAEHAQVGTDTHPTPVGLGLLADNWRKILEQGNLPEGRAIDGVMPAVIRPKSLFWSATSQPE